MKNYINKGWMEIISPPPMSIVNINLLASLIFMIKDPFYDKKR